MSIELESEATGRDQAGFNSLEGYGKFKQTIPETLKDSFRPDVPSIDPMVSWRMKQRDKADISVENCDGFEVTPKQYHTAMTQANQKGYKKTKSGTHGTPTEFFQTDMLSKKGTEKVSQDSKPTLDNMNQEYNRYKYGYQLLPANNGQNLDGAKPVLLTGNELIYQPPIAEGAGEGGRRAGLQQNKYALPIGRTG